MVGDPPYIHPDGVMQSIARAAIGPVLLRCLIFHVLVLIRVLSNLRNHRCLSYVLQANKTES